MGNTRGIPAKVKDKKKSYPHSWLFKLVVDLLANMIIHIRTEKKKKKGNSVDYTIYLDKLRSLVIKLKQ